VAETNYNFTNHYPDPNGNLTGYSRLVTQSTCHKVNSLWPTRHWCYLVDGQLVTTPHKFVAPHTNLPQSRKQITKIL